MRLILGSVILAMLQASDGPLDIPRSEDLRCEQATLKGHVGVRAAFQFEMGGPGRDWRTMTAGFDERGIPVVLNVLSGRFLKDTYVQETFFLRFPPADRAQGMRTFREGTISADPVISGLVQEKATAADLEKGRALAEWLWTKRCHAGT